MFSKDDYVVYGLHGVCRVKEIKTLDIQGVQKEREYYILVPVEEKMKLYVPVDAANKKIRNVISKQEAESLIYEMHKIEPLIVDDDKYAEKAYENCMKRLDCTEWIRLIKCIYQNEQNRMNAGKKVTVRDEKYMKLAENALYGELGIALGIPKNQVLDYIFKEKSKGY